MFDRRDHSRGESGLDRGRAHLRLPEDAGLVNVDLKLNYLRAATSGGLTVHSQCLRAGRQLSYAEARVVDQQGMLVAHGTSTLMAKSGNGLQLGVPKISSKSERHARSVWCLPVLCQLNFGG